PTPALYTLSLHDALPIFAAVPHIEQHAEEAIAVDETKTRQMLEQQGEALFRFEPEIRFTAGAAGLQDVSATQCPRQNRLRAEQRSEEHTSELQSQSNLVC